MTAREDPVVPLNPATHPLREEALIAWRDKYAKQSLISDAPPSWFKCFTQGYVAGHDALTAQLAALRAERDEAVALLGECASLVKPERFYTRECSCEITAEDLRDEILSRTKAIVARRKAT